MAPKFETIKKIVAKELVHSCHDIDHVLRVYNLCLTLAKGKKVDWEVLKIAALLHDIGRAKEDRDPSGKTDHALVSARLTGPILKKTSLAEDKIGHIKECIISHRYRTGCAPKSLEAKILFDADKLDSLGAIGVARALVWVGRHNAKIYCDDNPQKYASKNLVGGIGGRIKDKTKHSIQIEYKVKLKFIINKLYTAKAKKIARTRMKYFEDFLKRLEQEVKGKL
jgi:uncharacterized protein